MALCGAKKRMNEPNEPNEPFWGVWALKKNFFLKWGADLGFLGFIEVHWLGFLPFEANNYQ